MIDDGRVDLQDGRDAAPVGGTDTFAGEVVIAFQDHINPKSIDQISDLPRRRPAKHLMFEKRSRRMEPVDLGSLGVTVGHDVNFVPPFGQPPGNFFNVNRTARRTGDGLIGRDVKDFHEVSEVRRSKKNGPVRMRPKRETSSFIMAVAKARGPCAQLPTFGRIAPEVSHCEDSDSSD